MGFLIKIDAMSHSCFTSEVSQARHCLVLCSALYKHRLMKTRQFVISEAIWPIDPICVIVGYKNNTKLDMYIGKINEIIMLAKMLQAY